MKLPSGMKMMCPASWNGRLIRCMNDPARSGSGVRSSEYVQTTSPSQSAARPSAAA